MDTSLFARGPSPTLRFVILIAISVALMVYDQRTEKLETFRVWMGTLLYPVQTLVDLPSKTSASFSEKWAERKLLLQENQDLKEQNRFLSARLQEFVAIRNENDRLRELLGSQARSDNQVSSARLLAVSLSDDTQKVLLDKGIKDGVNTGMAIVDDAGLMGQVTRAYPFHSEGMLISDPSHAIPIQIARNGLRDTLGGTGFPDILELLHPSINADIEIGDILVTSGMGGRFPSDFPVAKVTSVERPQDSMFARIKAAPLAKLEQSRNVLILHSTPRAITPTPVPNNNNVPDDK